MSEASVFDPDYLCGVNAHHAMELEELRRELADALVSREAVLNELFAAREALMDDAMERRDMFAGVAMEALHMRAIGLLGGASIRLDEKARLAIAKESYLLADAMLAHR